MHLVLYIGLGAGLAVAAGLRPFLPALLAGALASGHVLGLTFAHSDYSFLQSAWWLVAMAVALVLAYALQRLLGSDRVEPGPVGAALGGLGVGIGALLCAGVLAGDHDLAWPGLLGGAACAVLGGAAVRPLLGRTRARLADRTARDALTLYLDAASLVLAALVALLHPLGYVAAALMAWLLLASRRRAGEKYAGLRILRH